jgi:hypothetical protein
MGEVMRAYPVEGLLDPINDMVNGTPVVVLPTATGAGFAVAGPLEGTALEPLATRTTFWFALIGAFPGDRDLRVSTTINVVTIWPFLAELRGCP